MADPLSLAASLAGLVSLADSVFRHVYKYVRGAVAAKEEITKIAQELQSFTGILRGVQVLAQSLEEEGDTYDPSIRVHHVYYCEQTLTKIHDRMKRAAQKIEKGKPKDGLAQQLKWPFSRSETQEVLQELERHKANMNLGIATDSMQKMQLLLSKQKEADVVVNETRRVVRELRTEILVDARKRRVLEFFMNTETVNPQTSLDTNIKLRHPMTGLWLTESPVFIQWLDTPGSRIWLSGIPGGGKTVLAGAAVQEALTRASPNPTISAAFFFCDFKNEKTLKATNIFGAIASQLARQKNEAFDLLQDCYENLHPVDGLPKKADADDLRALVGKMCELFEQVLIVVDGIDECGDGMDEIAEMLSDLASDSETISLAVFSRDEADIRRQLSEDFKSISISARSRDIELYVRAELELLTRRGRLRVTNMSLQDAIREALVDQAQGMFRWVACQLEYLCGFSNDFERREALGQLPPTLHETYLRILQRLSRLPLQTQSKIQMCFHFIAFCPIRLSALQLREAISTPEVIGASLDDHMVSEDYLESICGSLFKKSMNDTGFEFAHFSVREFLEHESLAETPGLEKYRISRSECHRLLAVQSLRYLQLSTFVLDDTDLETVIEHANMTTDRREGYSYHRLAARFALQMAAQEDSHPILRELMLSLFHPSNTSCLTLFAMSVFLDLFDYCHISGLTSGEMHVLKSDFRKRLLSDGFRPIHLAAALNLPTVCDYLIRRGSDPTAKSPFGTPLELSIESCFGLFHDCLDFKAVAMKPHRLRAQIQSILPSSTQRNSTVEILERSSPEILKLHQPWHPRNMEVIVPCIIGFAQNDFQVLQRLLTKGVALQDSTHPAVFRELIYGASELIEKDPEPLLGLIKHIGSLLDSESQWRLDIGRTIWNIAVDLELPFTKNPSVTDSRIMMSKDALVARAFLTIATRDLPGLQTCLADERLHVSERHRDPWWRTHQGEARYMTLLHYAVQAGNLEATSHLAAAGCDPNIPLIWPGVEYPAMHDCNVIEIFEELVAFGANMTAREAYTGETFWHGYAKDPDVPFQLLDSVAKRYPLETAEALLTKSTTGKTPLTHALSVRQTGMPREDHVERIMEVITICSDLVGFWSIHEPLFRAAAEFGSQRVLNRLIEAGARLDPVDPSQQTPLHHVGVETSAAMVRRLKELYPTALDARFDGQLPLQLYLERCCHQNHAIEDSVAQELLSPESLESIDGNGTTLWEHYWGSSHIQQHAWRRTHAQKGFVVICAWLLKSHSAMLAYESVKRRSGVNMVFVFFVAIDWTEQLASTNSSQVLGRLIDASCYWEEAKIDPSVLRFLQFTIRNQLYRHINMLLDHDVSVSEIVDDYSSVQIACESLQAISFCSSAEGKETLCKLVDIANKAHLNDLAMDGLTILHRLATDGETGSQLHWLIDGILAKGVEINKRGKNGATPIMHHVFKRSLHCAEYLLQAGADPAITDNLGADTAMEASYHGFRPFLEKLLESSKTRGSPIEWRRRATINWTMENGQDITLTNASVVHFISLTGHVDCLAFYIDNNLIEDLEVATPNGWTPMHVCARGGDTRMIEYLESSGCQIMPQTEDGTTPLHLAVQQKQYDACRALIRLGAQDVPDITGITPTMHALKGNDKVMIQLMDEMLSSESVEPQQLDVIMPRKISKALIAAMGQAIRSDDIKECKRLYELGCPVNFQLGNCSPLALALYKGNLEIADWLLDNGTNTSLCMCQDDPNDSNDHYDGRHCVHVIDLCLRHSELNKLLAKLVDHCMTDGSGWPVVGNAGLSRAILNDNMEGLSIVVEYMQEKAESISAATNIPQAQVLHTVINQLNRLDDAGRRGTALHCASDEDSMKAMLILLKSGADIDKVDSEGRTALWGAHGRETITALVRGGASLVDHFSGSIFSIFNWSANTFQKVFSSYSEPNIGHDSFEKLPGLFLTTHDTRGSIDCRDISITLDRLGPLLKAGIKLNQDLGSGMSPMHLAIIDKPSSGFILNCNLGLEVAAPFPWHLEFWSDPSFMTSMFRHFRKKLSAQDFARVANLQPDRGWSPLCHASVTNNIDMIHNCLSLGADIDFEGSPHGSAVIVASACGQIEAVRSLVRAGASISYKGEKDHKSVFTFCRSRVVRRWLLVDRFTEQPTIDMRPHWGEGQRVCLGAGIAVAGLKLVGLRGMCYYDSRIDYAERLAKMRKDWRGKAIPPICMSGIVYGS